MEIEKALRRLRVRRRIRRTVVGSSEAPRLSVFRSNRGIYAQLIDDAKAYTLVHSSSAELETKGRVNREIAKKVGLKIAERAKEKGLTRVVFDRGGYAYHGKVKSLAEGAREGGLIF